MRGLVRWSGVVLSLSIIALVTVVLIGVTWNDRADHICRRQAPSTASGYSITWEWSEFAYVCDYRTPDKQAKRVGIIEAFHGEGRRRHRPDR